MVNYYIFCHGCYIPFHQGNYKNPNINLWFDAEFNNESCSENLNISFDHENYPFKENYMNPQFDYILSFNDVHYSSNDTSIKMFGLFDDFEERIEIKNITNKEYNDILLSQLLEFIVKKNERANIYCSFCRKECENQTIPLPQTLEYDTEEPKVNDISDIKVDKLDDVDDDINFKDLFIGGKHTYVHKKTLKKRRLKNITSRKYKKLNKYNKRHSYYKKNSSKRKKHKKTYK